MMIQVQYFQSLLQAKINLRVKKQLVFGTAESWQKYSTHGYKQVLFINYRCEKGYQSTSLWTFLRSETPNDIPFYPKISAKCFKRGTASTRIVRVVLALDILRNGFFLQVDTRSVYLHWCKWCTYLLGFHSVLLQWAVNESVCSNDEGKLTVRKWKRVLKHATTWHHIPHHQTWAYSAAHARGKLTYLSIRVERKDYRHKKAIYPKNHWIISVPQNTSLVYHTFMWIKLTVWVITELNKNECAIDKIRVVQQYQPPKWISCRLRVIKKLPEEPWLTRITDPPEEPSNGQGFSLRKSFFCRARGGCGARRTRLARNCEKDLKNCKNRWVVSDLNQFE